MTVNTAAPKHADTTVATPVKRTRDIELDESFEPLLDELSEVLITLSAAKQRSEDIKAQLKAEAGMNADKFETLIVRVKGRIRAKISLREQKRPDLKLLQEAFPEAFSTVMKDSASQVVNTI